MKNIAPFITTAALVSALASVAAALAGCGMTDMPNKMDQSNANMGDMKSKMDVTNAKMDTTNANMLKTNGAIHKQTLSVALTEMLKTENSTFLQPAPTGMMAAGKVFAEEATAQEICELTTLYFKEINEVTPDASLQAEDGSWPAPLAKSLDHDKTVKYNALLVIAGFAPQSIIEEIVSVQIEQGGQYIQAAYAILQLRATFVRQVLVEQDIFADGLSQPGQVQAAVDRLEYLDYIARLPLRNPAVYADHIAVKTRGMLIPADNIDVKLSGNAAADSDLNMRPLWARVRNAALDDRFQAYVRDGNHAAPAVRFHALRAKIQGYVDFWANAPVPTTPATL